MTSRHLSARLDALVESLAPCSLPTPTTLALEAAAALLAAEDSPLQKKYHEFFDALLKKYGVSSPADLSDEQKSKFFDECAEGWKGGEGPTEKAKEELSLTAQTVGMDDVRRAIRASLQATLAIKAYERMANPPTAPIYDQVFVDGVAALDAAALEPNMVVVKVYNIGDEDYDEEDWVVDVGWAHVEGNSTTHSGSWAGKYPLPKAVTRLLESDAKMTKPEAIDKAKKVIHVLKNEGLPIKTSIVASTVSTVLAKAQKLISAAKDRNSAVVVTIPMVDKYAKRFPDPVTANHGHDPHLTLLFIGNKEYPPGEMSQILSTIRGVARKMPPFRLYVDPNAGLQDFGPNEETGEKALWLPARSEPRGELERLYRMTKMALEQEGIDVSAHDSFKPHVTWSYVPNDQPEPERNRMNAAVADRFKDGFYFDVRQIVLSMPDGSSKVVALSPLPRKT